MKPWPWKQGSQPQSGFFLCLSDHGTIQKRSGKLSYLLVREGLRPWQAHVCLCTDSTWKLDVGFLGNDISRSFVRLSFLTWNSLNQILYTAAPCRLSLSARYQWPASHNSSLWRPPSVKIGITQRTPEAIMMQRSGREQQYRLNFKPSCFKHHENTRYDFFTKSCRPVSSHWVISQIKDRRIEKAVSSVKKQSGGWIFRFALGCVTWHITAQADKAALVFWLPTYVCVCVCVCSVVWVRDNWDQVVINRENPVGDGP